MKLSEYKIVEASEDVVKEFMIAKQRDGDTNPHEKRTVEKNSRKCESNSSWLKTTTM